jgi:hypothetical protein
MEEFSMKISIEQIRGEKPKTEPKLGQIYSGCGSYYIVSKAYTRNNETLYNLTNLETGSRWTNELSKDELEAEINFHSFKLVNVKEIVIKEEI